MSLPVVLGSRAEAACRLLNQTLGLHRMQAARILDDDALARLAIPAFDGRQVQRQAIFLRMISITEAFCVDRLLELAENEVSPSENNVRTVVWENAATSAVSNWPSIRSTYKSWYDIRPSWTRITHMIEVRNAIAHGLGHLTRTQLAKRQSVTSMINEVGINISNNRIVLEEETLHHVRTACIDLISEVDHLIQAKTGDVR